MMHLSMTGVQTFSSGLEATEHLFETSLTPVFLESEPYRPVRNSVRLKPSMFQVVRTPISLHKFSDHISTSLDGMKHRHYVALSNLRNDTLFCEMANIHYI
jgi:hypothetical protein